MSTLPLPPVDVVENLPGASAAPPDPGGAAEEEDGEDRKIFVDPVVFLEGIVADRTLRKALHPSARTAIESILLAVSYKGTDNPISIATSLLKVGEILRTSAERRAKALHLAAESFRVALGLFGETVGREHHVTLKARLALGETLAAADRRVDAAAELETVVEALERTDPASPTLAKAQGALRALDAHPTVGATLRRATRKDRGEKADGLRDETPILYGKFAGRDPPPDGEDDEEEEDDDDEGTKRIEGADAPKPQPWAPPDPDANAVDPTKLGLEINPFMSAHDIRRQRLKKKWLQIETLRGDNPILYGRYTGKTPVDDDGADDDDGDGADGVDEAAALDHLPGRLSLEAGYVVGS